MLDVEVQAHDAVPPAKRERFGFLLAMRNALARASAELSCWGAGPNGHPMIDRQFVLLEDALTNLVSDDRLVARLRVEWAASDARLLHQPGTAPAWCTVCQRGGYTLEVMLGTMAPVHD